MITLTTDFGPSEYVGIMKGVIYSINPIAKVVDLTHNIRPFDIRHGAYAIYSAAPYFPRGTVHIVVVDPGVGTQRKGIIIESSGHFFVGPDNGVFSLIKTEKIFEIETEKTSSFTFHGRDVFAPAGAKIDAGASPVDLGRPVKKRIRIVEKEVEISDRIRGEVFCIDGFGNIITNIEKKHLDEKKLEAGSEIKVRIGENSFEIPIIKTYGSLEKGDVGALINSSRHLELAVREGSAAQRFDVRGGEAMEVSV